MNALRIIIWITIIFSSIIPVVNQDDIVKIMYGLISFYGLIIIDFFFWKEGCYKPKKEAKG